MNTNRALSTNLSGRLWLIGLTGVALLLASPGEASPRKPKYQEPAPEITAQALEQSLADETLSRQEFSQSSVSLARIYYQLKEFDREAEVLEDALAAGITDTNLACRAHYYLGRTYEALGADEQAANEFLTVWDQCPGCDYHLNAAMEIGDLTLLASNTVDATQWYEAVRDLQPMSKLAFLARDKLRALTNGVSAEVITDESHRPVFQKEQFHRLDQYLYSQLHDKAEAQAQQLSDSATTAPLRAAMSYHLAHHYWMYGDVEGAGRFVTNALQTTGERHVQALILAGHIARALGQTDTALGYYHQAITAAPKQELTITAYQQSTRLLYKSGQPAAALALAASGAQAFSGKPELAAYLDRIANTLRDRAEPQWTNYAAQVAATTTSELGRRALMQLANHAQLRGDWAGTEQLYRHLVARPGKNWRSNADMQLHLLAAQVHQTNRVASAKTEVALRNSVKNTSDAAEAYVLYRLGKIWMSNGQTNNAEAAWQQFLREFPQTHWSGMAQIHLARLYESQGNLTNAVSLYETFLQNSEAAPHFRLRAYANLFRLKNALGDPVSASAMLDKAKTLALQSKNAGLELSLAQYFLHRSDTNTAQQLLSAGISGAEAMIRTEKDPQKRLRLEYLIIRRLDDFHKYAQLGDRAAKIDMALLQNPNLDTTMRLAVHCYLMRGLEASGRWDQAEALCQQVIQLLPEDSARLGHVLYRLAQQARNRGQTNLVSQFAQQAFREVPTSYISQYMYLHLAVDDFNAGQYTSALSKVAELQQAVPVSRLAPKGWAASYRWDCQYVQGYCLRALGNTKLGQQLIAQAIAQQPSVAQEYTLVRSATPPN